MCFPNVKLMISCFHKKLIKQVLVSDPWHHKVASWAPECKKCWVLYYFLDARGGADGWILGPMGVPRHNVTSGYPPILQGK